MGQDTSVQSGFSGRPPAKLDLRGRCPSLPQDVVVECVLGMRGFTEGLLTQSGPAKGNQYPWEGNGVGEEGDKNLCLYAGWIYQPFDSMYSRGILR